jgi:CubicO group peptidase (beta-lactamase class C family)
MTLKSAYEDLRERTVERIPGTWGRLKYVAGLRSSTGDYAHWGLERVHGPGAAQDAFMEVHKKLVKTILRTRLGALREDLGQSSEAEGISPASYASTLSVSLNQLLPSGCPKESQLHLSSVLETLSTLEARRNASFQSS